MNELGTVLTGRKSTALNFPTRGYNTRLCFFQLYNCCRTGKGVVHDGPGPLTRWSLQVYDTAISRFPGNHSELKSGFCSFLGSGGIGRYGGILANAKYRGVIDTHGKQNKDYEEQNQGHRRTVGPYCLYVFLILWLWGHYRVISLTAKIQTSHAKKTGTLFHPRVAEVERCSFSSISIHLVLRCSEVQGPELLNPIR